MIISKFDNSNDHNILISGLINFSFLLKKRANYFADTLHFNKSIAHKYNKPLNTYLMCCTSSYYVDAPIGKGLESKYYMSTYIMLVY